MKNRSKLQQLFQELSEVLPQEAGPDTEQRVLIAFRMRKTRARNMWQYWASAAACLVLLAGWFLAQHSSRVPQANAVQARSYSSLGAGFIALPYGQSDVPLEQAVIVRVNMRASDWDALGAPVALARPNNTIKADLLVGQDGVARAVRVVNVP